MYKINNYTYYGINPLRIFELCAYDAKSFYGKAKVIECEEGRYLQSYDTLICFLSYGGTFEKLWDGYSATTMRHINAFMRFIGCPSLGGKAWWNKLQVWEKPDKRKQYIISDLLNTF